MKYDDVVFDTFRLIISKKIREIGTGNELKKIITAKLELLYYFNFRKCAEHFAEMYTARKRLQSK
jgi:hypothetical protein